MKINKKLFEKVMSGNATEKEIKKLITFADSEIQAWAEFKIQCQDLLK